MQGKDAKYRQVVAWVKENIENGTFRPGDRLMSENELSEKFGLSRQTIRRATGELVNENLVTRLRGSGTYIGSDPFFGSGADETQTIPDFPQDSAAEPGQRERHMNIAVISTFNESYIFPGILKGIAGVLTENGYATQVFFTDNRLYREREILEQILDKDTIDGMIVEPVKSGLPNANIGFYRKLIEKGIPVIFFNTFYKELDVPCVRIDDQRAAYLATKMLLEAGHETIGAIFKSDDGQGVLRYRGFIEAMDEAGLQAGQRSVVWLDTAACAEMRSYQDYLFSRLEGCTGVVCYNDQLAYEIIQLALERGTRIPEDLSIVGIDDSYLASVCRIPFSSVIHPKDLLGRKTAENLIRMIRDPAYDGNCLMDVETVSRGSVFTVKQQS